MTQISLEFFRSFLHQLLPSKNTLVSILQQLHLVATCVSPRLCDSPQPLLCQPLLGVGYECLGSLMRLTFVTQAAHPALLADTLPGFLTCAVQAAGEGNALVAVVPLPPWFAPESGKKGTILNYYYATHRALQPCYCPNNACWLLQ